MCQIPIRIGQRRQISYDSFLEKTFSGALLLRFYVHFWNQYEKTYFLMPHSTYSFSSLRRYNNRFENFKGKKWKNPLNISENGCSYTDLSFSIFITFQNFMPNIEIMKFCQNHGSLVVCKGGGGYGVLGLRQINTCRKVPLKVNCFRWHFALPFTSLIFLSMQFIRLVKLPDLVQ